MWTITEPCLNPAFPQEQLENYHVRKIFVPLRGPTIWRFMSRNVWNNIVSWQTGRLNNSTKYLLHALMTTTSKRQNSQMLLKYLHLARIGKPELARSITKWTKACDKRLCRLISYIHHTCEYKSYCFVGNTAKQRRLGLFQDSDLQEILKVSLSFLHWKRNLQTDICGPGTVNIQTRSPTARTLDQNGKKC